MSACNGFQNLPLRFTLQWHLLSENSRASGISARLFTKESTFQEVQCTSVNVCIPVATQILVHAWMRSMIPRCTVLSCSVLYCAVASCDVLYCVAPLCVFFALVCCRFGVALGSLGQVRLQLPLPTSPSPWYDSNRPFLPGLHKNPRSSPG